LLLGWLRKTIQFLPAALEVLLALCQTIQEKSGVVKLGYCRENYIPSIGQENCCKDKTQDDNRNEHNPIYLIPNVLMSLQLTNGRNKKLRRLLLHIATRPQLFGTTVQ